ncbi:hypothetical protein ACJMK2_038806 [Sinanodonta woodiana]|uniref:EF-hand domain-containing protein n=1 Tax=Sinanodonta woodiana TaxID=1069815 RepID=A0ABD3WDD8_SINWO
MILLAEYIQAWTSFDTDGDSYLLKEEARAAVEQLEAGSNSYLEDMFGNQRFGFFEQQFKQIDNNNDGAVSLPEFEAYYNKFVPILDALDLFKNNIRKPPIIFSKRS